jgi:hypothetical protein
MGDLCKEAQEYVERRAARQRQAGRLVAFRLATGMDLDRVLASAPAEMHHAVLKLERLLERERLRGWARHWTYDLNRHIALGEALGELRTALAVSAKRLRASP